jgi:hypothetical protein
MCLIWRIFWEFDILQKIDAQKASKNYVNFDLYNQDLRRQKA